nr:uncharacterized protein LOC111751109 [Loxodonta africana]
MLELQEHPLKDLLEHVACSVLELLSGMNEVKGVYWFAFANCTEPDSQPVCLLLLHSTLFAMGLSDNHPGSMGIFHGPPLSGLKEIQTSFGGQSVRFLGPLEGLLFTVFCYHKTFLNTYTETSCCVLRLLPALHPLLKQDLVQLFLDWKTEISDLVLGNRVGLSSKFQNTLVNMIYFLHENMKINIPSLAEGQLLLYTTMTPAKVIPSQPRPFPVGQGHSQLLVLLNTHIALVQNDSLFHPHTKPLNLSPPPAQFDVIKCHALSEFRCVADKKSLLTIELVFLQKLRLESDSRDSPLNTLKRLKMHNCSPPDCAFQGCLEINLKFRR